MKILGIALVIWGVAGLMWGGFNYTPVNATGAQGRNGGSLDTSVDGGQRSISVPPAAGAVLLIGGMAMLVSRQRHF